MIAIFTIFTFKPNTRAEGLPYLRDYLTMCQGFGLSAGRLAQSKNNSEQFAVTGHFDSQEDWDKFNQKLEQCELEGDCFSDLMPLLYKPPKSYSFELIEE